MGMSGNVSVSPTSLPANGLPPGPAQDRILRAVNDELTDKGFVVAQVDKLVNWARTGSLCMPIWHATISIALASCHVAVRASPT